MYKVLFSFIILLFYSGCTTKNTPLINQAQIDIKTLIKENNIPSISIDIKSFWQKYLHPWSLKKFDISSLQASWANRAFGKEKFFAENKLPWSIKNIGNIIKQTNFDNFNQAPSYAITTKNTQVRNLPTNKPFMLNPKLDGEGFAFDYLQNTRLHVNTPLLISHTNLDGSWVFAKNPSSYGWIKVSDIYKISKEEINKWKNYPKLVITKDNTPIYDIKQNFLFYSKMGDIYPLINDEKDNDLYKSFIYNRYKGKLYIKIPKEYASKFPLHFDKQNISKTTGELLRENYGWGSFMGNRDCSALTQDYFRVFGIWLPRNSSFQSKYGTTITLKGKSDKEKEQLIQKNALAFLSLLHLKGHIMLYVGTYKDKSYVLHNLWGIHTKDNTRYIIGKALISDLYLGKNLPNLTKESLLIERIDTLTVYPKDIILQK